MEMRKMNLEWRTTRGGGGEKGGEDIEDRGER